MKRNILTKKDILVVLACAAFLLLTLGSIGRSGREQARRTICANNLKQLGTLLDLYCADNEGYYPEAYSIWYMMSSSAYKSHPPVRGLLNILPYLVKLQPGSDIYEAICRTKAMDNVKDLKFFWCPSGAMQYIALYWQCTAFASFGYNQYCSRDNKVYCKIGDGPKLYQVIEHCPLKNVPHINNGQASNGGWITFTDIAFNGFPTREYARSNHHKIIRSTSGTSAGRSRYGCAGSNSLHVDGRVKWNDEKIMNDNAKLVHTWITPEAGWTIYASYWIYPRTP